MQRRGVPTSLTHGAWAMPILSAVVSVLDICARNTGIAICRVEPITALGFASGTVGAFRGGFFGESHLHGRSNVFRDQVKRLMVHCLFLLQKQRRTSYAGEVIL